MTPAEVRREHVSGLSLRIAEILNREKISDSFLALLLNVDFVIDELLNHNPPDELADALRDLQDLIARQTGCQTLFGETTD